MWTLTRFGSTYFASIFNRSENMGTSPVQSSLIQTAAGWYDTLGSNRAKQAPAIINCEGEIYTSSMATQVTALNALIGKRDALYRTWEDGTVQWCTARLLDVSIDRTWPQKMVFPIKMVFQALGVWNGVLHSGVATIDQTPYLNNLVLTNNGNLRQPHVYLKFQIGSSSLSQLYVESAGNGISWGFTPYGVIGGIWVNSETMLIESSPVGIYDYFYFDNAHTCERFLSLEPGTNNFTVTWYEAEPLVQQMSVTYLYYDAWA